MLKALRFRLSLLYLAASLGLVALLGAATYGLLAHYFQSSTDLALHYRMAIEFRLRGMDLPASLLSAEQDWTQGSDRVTLSPIFPSPVGEMDDEEGEDSPSNPVASQPSHDQEERYDGSLAPVFLLAEEGSAPVSGVPMVNDPAAVAHAVETGSDLRTVTLDNGVRLRLLTYRTGSGSVLQVGRLVNDQDRLLSQYLTGLLVLGSILSLLLGLASWALAGRSIQPAQRAWDQQQQFISNASHELRTPLTLLRANADYALRNSSVVERENSLRDILAECDYMNRMVEDLLLLSRLDAHRLNLATDPVSLADLLSETVQQVEKLASSKGVTLVLEPASGTVRGDPPRLRQVLLILLDNALRFTPPGGTIRLGAQVHNREATVTVADSGAGIPPSHLPHIFERFYQVPGQPGEERGNGLGLSIARGLVEAHHGRITLSSQPGVGTTVRILLPVA